jgi:hypothetical protein
MGTGVSLILIAAGAILTWAVMNKIQDLPVRDLFIRLDNTCWRP